MTGYTTVAVPTDKVNKILHYACILGEDTTISIRLVLSITANRGTLGELLRMIKLFYQNLRLYTGHSKRPNSKPVTSILRCCYTSLKRSLEFFLNS